MIRRLSRFAAAVLAAGLLANGAQAQPGTRSLIYRVDGPAGATVYMLGSVHLLSADLYPLAAPVEDAYADAEHVFFEVHLDSLKARQTELALRGLYQDGRTLRSELPAEVYARLEQAAAGYAQFGITMQVLDRMKPWLVSLMLQALEWQKAGMVAEHGVDAHFAGRARQDGKGVGAFESVDFQLGLFDGFTPQEQVKQLESTLEQLPRTAAMLGDILDAWRTGDAVALDSIISHSLDDSPELFARMLTDRNAAWVPRIEAMLRGTDDVLVVVGAAHLVGEQGVVSMLRERGFTVEQL